MQMKWVEWTEITVGQVVHGLENEDGSQFIFPSVDATVIFKCPKHIKIQYPFGDTEVVPTTTKFYVEEKE